MRENLFLLFITLSLLGCGAQNNPNKKETVEDEVKNDNIIAINELQILPEIINITFPKNITNFSQNSLFNQDIERINQVINLSKHQLNVLKPLMSQIIKGCEGKKVCSFPKNHFEVKENNRSITLGKITFVYNDENQTYPYQLYLEIGSTEKLTIQWREDKSDVITIYQKEIEQTTLHYLTDLKNKEAMVVKERREEEYNSFLIQQDETNYHLSSNHIKNASLNFSSNIKLEKNLLVEYNENLFKLQQETKNIKEGSYLLLPLNQTIEALKLIDILELAQGTVSLFHGEVQGFLYNNQLKNYKYFKL